MFGERYKGLRIRTATVLLRSVAVLGLLSAPVAPNRPRFQGPSDLTPQGFLVFGDVDGDGLRKNGDPQLSGVQVCVQQPPDTGAITCSRTNENGSALFLLQFGATYSATLSIGNPGLVPTDQDPITSGVTGEIPELGGRYMTYLPFVSK